MLLEAKFVEVDPDGYSPSESAAFAELTIRAGDLVATRHRKGNGRVSDSLFLPLAPLAGWLVSYWYPLQFSPSVDLPSGGYLALPQASAGYPLPNVEIQASGDRIKLSLSPYEHRGARIHFLEGGTAFVELADWREAMEAIVTSVAARLEAGTEPWLDLWRDIQLMDADERAYCELAAMLGRDPFGDKDLTDELVPFEPLLSIGFDAVQAVSKADDRPAATQSVVSDIDRLTSAQALPAPPRFSLAATSPWRAGYRLAEALRSEMDTIGWLEEAATVSGRAPSIRLFYRRRECPALARPS